MENSIWKGIHPLKWKIVHNKENLSYFEIPKVIMVTIDSNLALVMVNYTMMQVYITWSVKSLCETL
jgi:hypothetical protein